MKITKSEKRNGAIYVEADVAGAEKRFSYPLDTNPEVIIAEMEKAEENVKLENSTREKEEEQTKLDKKADETIEKLNS